MLLLFFWSLHYTGLISSFVSYCLSSKRHHVLLMVCIKQSASYILQSQSQSQWQQNRSIWCFLSFNEARCIESLFLFKTNTCVTNLYLQPNKNLNCALIIAKYSRLQQQLASYRLFFLQAMYTTTQHKATQQLNCSCDYMFVANLIIMM